MVPPTLEQLLKFDWNLEVPALFPVECLIAVLIPLYALVLRRRPAPTSWRWLWIERLAGRPVASCAGIVAVVLLARACLLVVAPIPQPIVRDEFSYLLAADTFASGRVANPSHSEWVHFEAPYIINRPTYGSIYPPGQGLALAFGKVLFGHPWWGVWLSTGLLCGAVCWALQGWLPPRWALFGAAIAAIRFGVGSYWMNSYWGGSLAALGGALALGAFPRLRTARVRYGVVLAGGLLVMGITRPYEGFLLALGLAGAALYSLFAHPAGVRAPSLRSLVNLRFLGPAVLVLVAGAAGLAYYCWKTTGSPLELPYTVFVREYWGARHLIPMAVPPEPAYRHNVFHAMAVAFREEHVTARSITGFLWRNASRALGWWLFYCGPILLVPLVLGYRALLDRRIRPVLIVVVVFAAGLSLEVSRMPHYAAPATAVWILIWVQAFRHTVSRGWGRWFSYFVPAGMAAVLLLRFVALASTGPRSNPHPVFSLSVANWCCVPTNGVQRADVARDLMRFGGRHLVFFRTPKDRMIWFDWVYNQPDIDSATIVWARAMSADKDASLVARYRGRQVWVVDADEPAPSAKPYRPAVESATPDAAKPGAPR